MNNRAFMLAAVAFAMILPACGSEPPPAPPEPPPTNERTEPERNDPQPQPEEMGPTEDEIRARLMNTIQEVVLFDFDDAALTAQTRARLEDKLPILRSSPTVTLMISGHADERGSDEYNLALGSRRAESVRQFLVGSGLDASRFEILSYGESRPAVRQSNESAWTQNRRAEFEITGGRVVVN